MQNLLTLSASFIKGFVCLLLMSLLLEISGCAGEDEGTVIPDECPDFQIFVTFTKLSSTLDPYGRVIEETDVFFTDTKEIFFSFSLSDNLCCRNLFVYWYSDLPDPIQMNNNINPIFPVTLSLKTPSDGFLPGQYKVVIYIDMLEKMTIPFKIENRPAE